MLQVHSWFPNSKILTLVRFLGTTPKSSQLQTTLQSICKQIAVAYDRKDMLVCPVEFSSLVAHFHKCLTLGSSEKPLILFLDSLDQLSATNHAHKVSWLPVNPPPGCHIVVSTVTNMYNILANLEKRVSRDNIVKLDLLGDELGLEIVTSWLTENGRTLTPKQLVKVSAAITKCSLPLYVKLIYDQVYMWRSYEAEINLDLSTSVRQVINKLFERLERKHGHTLVKHALGYITSSISGLSETELEDILSIDDIVLADVFQYHVPPVRRIPSILWIRIRHDMSSYLVTREADGTEVVHWYHRQFIEAAMDRYISNQSESFNKYIHTTVSEFFQGTWHGKRKPFVYTPYQMKKLGLDSMESEEDRRVASQPLLFELSTPKRYNLRKLNNLPFHLANAGFEHRELLKDICLFNYEWLHAKLVTSGIHSVLSDLDMLKQDHECHTLRTALNLARSTLSQNPDTLGLEISGRLIHQRKDRNIQRLVEDCFVQGSLHNGLVVKQQCYNAPGGALRYYLEHPDHHVQDLVMFLSATGSSLCVVSITNNIVVWDLTNGEIEKEVRCLPELSHSLNVLSVYPGRVVLTGCYQHQSNPVVIFDTEQCEVEQIVTLEKVFKGVGFVEDYKVELFEEVLLITVIGKEASFFDLKTGKEVKVIEIIPCAQCVTSDRRHVLFADKSHNKLSVVDVESMQIVQELTTCEKVTCIVEALESELVALTCNKMCEISLYKRENTDKVTKRCTYQSNGTIDMKRLIKSNKKQQIYLLRSSPRGTYIMIYVPDSIILWDCKKKKAYRTYELADAVTEDIHVTLTDIQFSSDERFLFACHIEHLVVWSITYGRVLRNICVEPSLKINALIATSLVDTASGCTSYLACTSIRRARHIKVWEWEIKEEEPLPRMRLSQSCRYLSVAEQSGICIARSFSPRETSVIDLHGGRVRAILSPDADVAHIDVSKSGRYAILREINSYHPVRIWNTSTCQPLMPLPLNPLKFCSCVCSDSERYIVTHCEASISEDVAVQIWDLKSSVEVTKIKVKEGGFEQIYFADDDKLLILHQVYSRLESEGRNRLILICDVETGDVIQEIDRILTSTLHVAPDRKHIIYVRCGSSESGDRLVTMKVSRTNGNQIIREHTTIPIGRRLFFSRDASRAIDLRVRCLDMIQDEVICDFNSHIFKNQAMFPKITPNGSFAVWINSKESLINVGRIDRNNPQVIAQCYIHASPVSLGLYSDEHEDLVIVGATDGRILLLNIVDPSDTDKTKQKSAYLLNFLNDTVSILKDISSGIPDDDNLRRTLNGEMERPRGKRSSMCIML